MAVSTPIADIGWKAPMFRLKGVDSHYHTLSQLSGMRGTVVVFICNHCPYVKAVMPRLIRDAKALHDLGVHTIAINANDDRAYPEDSFSNMKVFAKEWDLPFHYLYDDTQEIAKAYDAVCTPDFFGFDADLRLQYRGRLDAGRKDPVPDDTPRELYDAMRLVAHYGYGPGEQQPSMGCSIKWRLPQEDADLNWIQPAT
ncbi:MAG: thioredoxin family protein [Burkholderiales bacterium]|jgi:thiol-disulfide isomerase/thioredoxin|nr:MAG: thioredoxin family protein [Burkholderiales bacterium]